MNKKDSSFMMNKIGFNKMYKYAAYLKGLNIDQMFEVYVSNIRKERFRDLCFKEIKVRSHEVMGHKRYREIPSIYSRILVEGHLQRKKVLSEYNIGDPYDVRDHRGTWYLGNIKSRDQDKFRLRISFSGFRSKYDEWIDPISDRIEPVGTKTNGIPHVADSICQCHK